MPRKRYQKGNALANREMELLKAKESYEASENRPSAEDVTPSAESYVDDFSELDDQAWKVYGGEWKLQDDGLAQLKDGAERSVLRLRQPVPDDFEATLKFVTTGGSRWRSKELSLMRLSRTQRQR